MTQPWQWTEPAPLPAEQLLGRQRAREQHVELEEARARLKEPGLRRGAARGWWPGWPMRQGAGPSLGRLARAGQRTLSP